ncbi:MAG: tetratricopeptide repeat protein [Desulfuromonadaceae bacterium]|nr:tetratricopeptide repeat protein [Desulfuromonadaceae bacterium]
MRPVSVRTIAVWFVLGCLLISPAVAALPPLDGPKISAAFDQELFELAHAVFLANSSLDEALAVTERALQARPADKAWRLKGAQTAEWAGRPDLALQHWFFLVEHGDGSAVQSALRISRSLNELPLRKLLLERLLAESATPELQKEYLAVVESLGLPEKGYTMLTSDSIPMSDPVWQVTERARLAENLGRPREAFDAWEQRALLKPLTTDESLHLATLWYGYGDAEQALNVLRHSARSTPGRETAFWRAYSDLAWSLQRTPEAVKGSLMLIRSGESTEVDYQRIQLTFQLSDPELAYPIIREGWQRFPKPVWWYTLVDTGLRCGRAGELAKLYRDLTPGQRSMLSRDGRSWYYLALLCRQTGNREASLKAVATAVTSENITEDLFSDCLWLLIDLKHVEGVRPLVMEWETLIADTPALREPVAAALLLLGEPTHALQIYRMSAGSRQNDPAWLASYGDVLEQAGHPEAAWQARRQAQNLVVTRLRSHKDSLETRRRDLLTHAQLMMYLSPGDNLSRLIRRIAEGNDDAVTNELIMGWAMSTGETDLARLWHWRSFARSTELPEWALLGLALEENDRSAIAGLLETRLARLPYRDAIEGAKRSGNTPLAETVAFEHFQVNDRDNLLDKQVRALYYSHPAAARLRLSLQELGGVAFTEEVVSFSYPATKRVAVAVEINNTEIRHQKMGVVREYFDSAQSGLLSVQMQHEKGSATLTAGVTDALSRFASYGISSDWHLNSRLALDLWLRLGWQATESVPLRIGGMKDEAGIGLLTAVTPRDTFSSRLTVRNLRDQERRMLGNGLSIEGEGTHRLLLDWPDATVRIFGGYYYFEQNGTPVGRTLALMPVGAAKDYFVPRPFTQIGGGITVGQEARTGYHRRWLPFAGADLSWSSVSGTGFRYELGAVGPVFGLDRLEGTFSQESGSFGYRDVNSKIELRYRYSLN